MQPPAFKSPVEDTFRMKKNDRKDDFFGLFDFLAHEAEVYEKYHPLRVCRSSEKSNRDKSAGDQMKIRAPF